MEYVENLSTNTPFFVRLVRSANGERLPTLIDRASGLPDFDATLWVVSSLRNKNHSSETIAQALRSIVILYLVLRSRKVNLVERLRADSWLTPADIEAVSKAARQTTNSAVREIDGLEEANHPKATNRVTKFEKLRMPMTVNAKDSQVDPGTTSIRMGYIREFLKWRVNRAIARADNEKKAILITLRNLIGEELQNKTPAVTRRATLGERIGIDRQAQVLLLNVVTPTNPQNPWTGNFIRVRNQFIVNAYRDLGVRRGEFLGMRIGDFNPQKQEVLVLRRPDDATDPRLREPNTKTRDRVLPVSHNLYRLYKNYIALRHDIVRGRHDFLLVANTGAPLSSSEMNRIFVALGQVPELPKIEPHILRHSFCENLGEDLHAAGKDDVEILGYLRQLGGWSDTSQTPCRYTKRFAQERAQEAGMAMQEKLHIDLLKGDHEKRR